MGLDQLIDSCPAGQALKELIHRKARPGDNGLARHHVGIGHNEFIGHNCFLCRHGKQIKE
jgi:hypothetical protein